MWDPSDITAPTTLTTLVFWGRKRLSPLSSSMSKAPPLSIRTWLRAMVILPVAWRDFMYSMSFSFSSASCFLAAISSALMDVATRAELSESSSRSMRRAISSRLFCCNSRTVSRLKTAPRR